MRRTLWIERPGTDGVVTDLTADQLPMRSLARGGDAIMPNGLLRQRRGWPYDGTTADVADNLVGVARVKFVLNGNTRTITCDDDGDFFIHNPSSAGTSLGGGSVVYLPRAVYGDELLICAQDGVTRLVRYSGASAAVTRSGGTVTYTAERATMSGSTWSSAPAAGSFVMMTIGVAADARILSYGRVLESTTTSLTIEGIRATNTVAVGAPIPGDTQQIGLAYPAVSIYEAGTVTVSAGTATGYGTKWLDAAVGVDDGMIVIPPTGSPWHASVDGSIGNTSCLVQSAAQATAANYKITRALPFKDVAAHKGSLWGIGVKQHKSRVYVGPVGWNIAFPPGLSLPVDPTVALEAESDKDFLMDFIDVPAPDDADECVACLHSENLLLVTKRKDAYGIAGSFGGLDVAMLPEGAGAGCIDIRSAWNLSIPVWAGTRSIHAFIGGRVRDLCKGRISREWQSLVKDFDYGVSDYCTIGEKDGALVVHLTTGGGVTQRTWHVYPFDETGQFNPRFLDRVSNYTPRYQWSSKVAGEADKILAVQDADQGRVIDYGPALDGTGIARDGDGTSPAIDLYFSSRIAREAGAKVDERVLEVAVDATITDSGGTSSTLGGSVVSTESLDSDATTTTSLSSMASKTADVPKSYVHPIGVKAGLHQLRLAKSATQTTETKTEISRIGVTVRASKRPV